MTVGSSKKLSELSHKKLVVGVYLGVVSSISEKGSEIKMCWLVGFYGMSTHWVILCRRRFFIYELTF